jgi:ABC-type nitrate/sulfonate/bicarbonate transport system substrate-binding protein
MEPKNQAPRWDLDPLSRRAFLKYGSGAVMVVASAGVLAACSSSPSSNDGASSGGESPATKTKVRIAYTATAFPSIVNNRAGVIYYGEQFGLDITEADLQVFADSGTATQAVLAGQADVVSGSFLSDLLLIQQGQPFKALVSVSNGNDLLMVGSGPIDTIEKAASDQAIVAVDSPGGLINLIYNAMFLAHNITQNVEDLPHTKVYGDSPPRTASFANGQTNVAVIHSTDLPSVQQALGADNVHTLSTLWQDVHGLIFEVIAAPVSWIEQNPDTATALMEAVVTGNRELAKDYSLYKKAIDQFIPGSGLTDADLKPIWELAREFEFWPYNGDLEDDSITFTQNVGNQSGVFQGSLSAEQVADRTPLEAALANIGTVSVSDITG